MEECKLFILSVTFLICFPADKDLCICTSRERTKNKSTVSSICSSKSVSLCLALSSSNIIHKCRKHTEACSVLHWIWLPSKHCWHFSNIRGRAEDKGDHLWGPVESLSSSRRTAGACNASNHTLPSAPSPRHPPTCATDAQHQLSARPGTSACSSSYRGRQTWYQCWSSSLYKLLTAVLPCDRYFCL